MLLLPVYFHLLTITDVFQIELQGCKLIWGWAGEAVWQEYKHTTPVLRRLMISQAPVLLYLCLLQILVTFPFLQHHHQLKQKEEIWQKPAGCTLFPKSLLKTVSSPSDNLDTYICACICIQSSMGKYPSFCISKLWTDCQKTKVHAIDFDVQCAEAPCQYDVTW